jgi:pimeloyl-ACP methyl ester carboxylesterase
MWRHQVADLALTHRVIVVDLPGHGTRAHEPFSFAASIDSLRRVIEREAGRAAVVVGSSLGGYVAMELATIHPEQVSGLVLVGASAEPRTVVRRAPFVAGGFMITTLTQALLRRPVNLESGHEPNAAHGLFFRGYGWAIYELLARSFSTRLATYGGPTLIINGEHDRLFHREQDHFRTACSGQLIVVPDSGHRVNEERSEHFNRLLERFSGSL